MGGDETLIHSKDLLAENYPNWLELQKKRQIKGIGKGWILSLGWWFMRTKDNKSLIVISSRTISSCFCYSILEPHPPSLLVSTPTSLWSPFGGIHISLTREKILWLQFIRAFFWKLRLERNRYIFNMMRKSFGHFLVNLTFVALTWLQTICFVL